MTNKDLDLSREWANKIYAQSPECQATVKIIQSLPDHIIDAEGLATLSDLEKSAQHAAFGTDGELTREQLLAFAANVERTIHKLLTPPLPTLAELIKQGNDPTQYQWMQCEEHDRSELSVILEVDYHYVYILRKHGEPMGRNNEFITPLPDLPRLEWPAQEPHLDKDSLSGMWADDGSSPSDAIEFLLDRYEDRALPRPEDVPAGEPWLVGIRSGNGIHNDQKFFGIRSSGGTWELFDTNEGWHSRWGIPSDITLISRLVPEVKP